MKSQTSAIIILIILGLAGAFLYAGHTGKLTFAVRPGASFKVVSYQLYYTNGTEVSTAKPGQDLQMKVCVEALDWNSGNTVYVEGGIIPNKWYNAGTYSLIGTFKNIPQFASIMSSKCCSSNEFYGGSTITFGTFDKVGTIKCTTFTLTVPSESSHDHCNNLGSAWAGYGSNYHYGATLFNGYCYPSSQEKVYDVEWYKTLDIKYQSTGTGSSGGGSGYSGGSSGSSGSSGSTGGTSGGTTTAPPSAYISGVYISKTFGKPGEPIELDVTLKNTNSNDYTYCVEGGIAPKTWSTFSFIGLSTISADAKYDKCCPQNEFYSSECETLQPGQQYTFKVYPHVPSQSSYDHCHGHGSAWAGYGSNYIIGVSVINDKCYPDPDEKQFYTNWNTEFTISNPTVIVNQTNQTNPSQGNQTYSPGPVYGQPIQAPITSGKAIIYTVVALGIGLIGYALYKRKR